MLGIRKGCQMTNREVTSSFKDESVSQSVFNNTSKWLGSLLYRFTLPCLLIIFALGMALIFTYIKHEQNLIIKKFQIQEETLYQFIIKNNHTKNLPVMMNDEGYLEAHESLYSTFLLLSTTLAIYLMIFIMIIHKLKSNSLQLDGFNKRLRVMNSELKNEIDNRDNMAHRLEELNNELKYQSLHDALTNLPNRRLFLDRLNQTIEAAKRKNRIFAVMLMDLDGFKFINDNLVGSSNKLSVFRIKFFVYKICILYNFRRYISS